MPVFCIKLLCINRLILQKNIFQEKKESRVQEKLRRFERLTLAGIFTAFAHCLLDHIIDPRFASTSALFRPFAGVSAPIRALNHVKAASIPE
jgi:hypothetical protein